MKNVLQKEIMKGIKGLALPEQYNMLNIIKHIGKGITLPNRMLAMTSSSKDKAMNEIRLALVMGPEKIDF